MNDELLKALSALRGDELRQVRELVNAPRCWACGTAPAQEQLYYLRNEQGNLLINGSTLLCDSCWSASLLRQPPTEAERAKARARGRRSRGDNSGNSISISIGKETPR